MNFSLNIVHWLMLLCSSILSIGKGAFIGQMRIRPYHMKLSSLSQQSTEHSDAALKFGATYTYTTSPIHILAQNNTVLSQSLHDFFRSRKHRDYLLIGSGNMKVRNKKSLSKDAQKRGLDALWQKEASFFRNVGIEKSSKNVEIVDLMIETPFLVFVINASALLGVKITQDGECEEVFTDGKVHRPEFQFLLLSEDFSADGPPPLVWIFDQLTGRYRQKSSVRDKADKPHMVHAYLRVWASDSKAVAGDIKADRIVFKACCRAEIDIKFPRLLLQILPAAKELIEKQGTRALQKSMERDVVPGVNKFRESFILWERKKGM